MKKTTIHDDEGLRLRVVIPIAFDRTSPSSPDCSFKSSDGAWCEDDDDNYYNYVDSEAVEDSECTEEEKVAVEQLAELRRIRRLSSQEGTDDYSAATAPCATEGSSFYTCEGRLPLSRTCNGHCTISPTASSSANNVFDYWKLKHMQGQQKQPPPPQQQQDEQDKFHNNIMDMIATTRDYKALHHHECSLGSAFGELPKSQTRSLSDIYRDKSVLPSSPPKKSKRRRKALSKIMEVGL